MSEEIKPGDIVQLKSGGPLMTCDHDTEDSTKLWCVWFDKVSHQIRYDTFSPIMLQKTKVEYLVMEVK